MSNGHAARLRAQLLRLRRRGSPLIAARPEDAALFYVPVYPRFTRNGMSQMDFFPEPLE